MSNAKRLEMIRNLSQTDEGKELCIISFNPKNYNGSYYLEGEKFTAPNNEVFELAKKLNKDMDYEVMIDTDLNADGKYEIEIENDDVEVIKVTYNVKEAVEFLKSLN